MSSLSYFTPAREEELLWSGNAGAATGPQPSTLGGEEARRFYQSLIEEGGGRGETRNGAEGKIGSEREEGKSRAARPGTTNTTNIA